MNTAINCVQNIASKSYVKKCLVGLNFEVMCYMTHTCNKHKISADR